MFKKFITMLAVSGVSLTVWIVLFLIVSAINPADKASQVDSGSLVLTPVPTLVPNAARANFDDLAAQVAPMSGITVPVDWGDTGQRLIEAGAIDLAKFEAHYGDFSDEQRAILLGDSLHEITFTPQNIAFWTNVLWAFGLTQESKVLAEGPMSQRDTPLGNYASTGGWTLGAKDAVALYSSARIVDLTPEQDDLVYRVAERVFRPCCGNATVFPDCNHGMAVLGLLELMASQGAGEDDLFRAALAFNSYAFPYDYITLAAYFSAQDVSWSTIDAEFVLSYPYSSGRGAAAIAQIVGPIPGAPNQGGSCAA